MLAFSNLTYGQLERHTWFFGGGNSNTQPGIQFDFDTNQPSQYNQVRYPLNLQENNIIVSNSNTGDVTFYSDGQIVVDGTHDPMPNGMGLGGSPSAMYGTAVVFDPSGCNRYFMITVQSEDDAIPRKINYSAIDLNLPGNGTVGNPSGDIDINVKNIDFTPTDVDCAESIFAISKSGNTKDSWLFFGDRREPTLYLYEVTSSGISYYDEFDLSILMPSLPPSGIFSIKMDYYADSDTEGRLIIAPGRNINQPTYPLGSINFNTLNGSMDNGSYQLIDDNTLWTYGTTFSPDGSKLYISDYIGKTLKQYDFVTGLLSTVATSSHNGRSGGLQTGPDGKVYWASAFVFSGTNTPISTLSVVNQPDEPGLNCDLIFNAWTIGAAVNPRLVGALPSFGTFPDPPSIALLSPDNCEIGNGSAEIIAGGSTAPLNYSWDNGEVTAIAINLTGGMHTTTITDEAGCETVLEIFISSGNEIIEPEVSGDLIICASGNAETILEVQDGFMNYLWSNGDMTQSTIISTPGVYTVTVSNAGCNGEVSVEVIEQNIDVTINGDLVLCGDSNDFVILEVQEEFVEYIWSNLSNSSLITVDQPGIYTVTVTDSNGCVAQNSVEVIMSIPPMVSISGDMFICDLGDTSTTLIGSPGFDSYEWSNGEVSQSIEVETAGFYSVMVTDIAGCTAATFIEVVLETISLNLGDDIAFCEEDMVQIDLDAGNNFENYLWSDQSTGQTFSALGEGIYSVEVFNDNGCIGTDTLEIMLLPSPESTIFGENIICEFGDTIATLQVTDDFETYQWSSGESSQIIDVSEPGNYSVTVTNIDNCEDVTSFEVELEMVSAEIAGRDFLCVGILDTIELSVSGGFDSYQWSSDEEGQMISITTAGEYFVTATNSIGCIAIDSILINSIEASVIVDLPSIIEIEYGESITLNPTIDANLPLNILWTPPEYLSCQECLSPTVIVPFENQIYQLLIDDESGCADSASVMIRVIADRNVFSPNVFSPNGDGVNDVFTLYGTPSLKEVLKLQIYDRWGELVYNGKNFPANDENYGWSGDFNGKPVNPAVFAWMAEVEFFDGTNEIISGSVTVVR